MENDRYLLYVAVVLLHLFLLSGLLFESE